MITPEQFEQMMDRMENNRNNNLRQILQAFMPAQEDRERLIKIEAKVETVILLGNANRNSDLEKITSADRKAEAAHKRVDGTLRWTIGSSLITVGGMILTALFVYIKSGGKIG